MLKIQTMTYYIFILSVFLFFWTGYDTPLNITASVLLLIIAIILTILLTLKKPIPKYPLKIVLFSLIFCTWVFIVFLMNNYFNFNRIFQIISGSMVALGISLSISNFKNLERFIKIIVFASFISALVAIGQVLHGDFFYTIWMGVHNTLSEDIIRYTIISKRPAGLSLYTIPLSYVLCSSLPLSFGLLSLYKSKRIYNIFVFFSILFALLLTLTRSAVAGGVLGVLYIVFSNNRNMKKKNRIYIVMVAILLISLYFFISGNIQFDRLVNLTGASAGSRLPMLITAFKYVALNPLGTGSYNPSLINISSYVSDSTILEYILNNSTHNHFTNVMVYYGFPGVFLVTIFYLSLFKRFKMVKNEAKTQREVNKLMILNMLMGSFVAHTFNSLFHNAGPFVGDYYPWYIIGIFLALEIIDKKNNNINMNNRIRFKSKLNKKMENM
jgi:hypothetical protein